MDPLQTSSTSACLRTLTTPLTTPCTVLLRRRVGEAEGTVCLPETLPAYASSIEDASANETREEMGELQEGEAGGDGGMLGGVSGQASCFPAGNGSALAQAEAGAEAEAEAGAGLGGCTSSWGWGEA